MRQEDCSTPWDPQQKMLDGRMWSVCNVAPQVCSVVCCRDRSSTALSSDRQKQTTLCLQQPATSQALPAKQCDVELHSNIKINPPGGRAKPAVPLAACVQRISSVDKANKNWLPSQRPLRNQKTNFRLIIYSHSSTNPENLAKISRVDLTKLV